MKELGLIALESADQMGTRIDQILSEWHDGRHFRIPSECIRTHVRNIHDFSMDMSYIPIHVSQSLKRSRIVINHIINYK